MAPVLAAVVWHYWLAVALVIPAILLVVVTAILYVAKVEMPRYNLNHQPTPEEFEAIEARRNKALEAPKS